MRIVAKRNIVLFCQRHPAAAAPLINWYEETLKAQWLTPQDIKNRHPSASFVARNRVVFNIKGNDYRLIVAVVYRLSAIYIKFIGTHAEYDKVDASSIEMET
ncbi:MAG: type II toxin-antitoxin system HigB family toxin [Proteobacteria bacterium]|nr:type II toxin-antitoxin system HigB family toxin [Pseudomonadota bacterium]